MMSDPIAGKYHKYFKEEFRMADLCLKAFGAFASTGSKLVWSETDYVAFRFLSPTGIDLIFYPHKVKGTGNVHIRVRDQGRRDKFTANRLMVLLDIASGHNCTFSRKNHHDINENAKMAKELGLEYGWAERKPAP